MYLFALYVRSYLTLNAKANNYVTTYATYMLKLPRTYVATS